MGAVRVVVWSAALSFTLLFTGLKLGGVLGWSWLQVASPVWGLVLVDLALKLLALLIHFVWDRMDRKAHPGETDEERVRRRRAEAALDQLRKQLL